MAKKNKAKGSTKKPNRSSFTHQLYLDRDLSLLNFNDRVLQQAEDKDLPLLERLRFLSIFHSNLDEFFMKRMVLTRNELATENQKKAPTHKRTDLIREKIQDVLNRASLCYLKSLKPELEKVGVKVVQWNQLTENEKTWLHQLFKSKIFPVLTPLAVDPGHPFPHISNLSTSLAVSVKYPRRSELFFSRIKIPKIFPNWVHIEVQPKKGQMRWINIKDIILNHLGSLFPNMEIVSTLFFRVTRNIEFEWDEEDGKDLLELVERELEERKYGEVVKLEHPPKADPWLLKFLMAELELSEYDLYEMKSELDLTDLKTLADINIPELKFKSWVPINHEKLDDESADLFHIVKQSDIFLHHPYENFTTSVERFIHQATIDPNVLAIKMTLYRTSDESFFIKSLMKAAELGKQVVCLIELKARFDEKKNIHWANDLENAGVHVVYGMVDLKTHCKLVLVVRQEADGIKTYAHVGTGNYHTQTAKLYTDVGLITARPQITKEIIELFHYLTGRSLKKDYKKLLVAPINLKTQLIEKINREATNAKKGLPSRIIIKCNNLEDYSICNALYEASRMGVKIDLLIRTICTLKPGLPGLSENIRVTSVVDRFLEHSRIFYFQNNKKAPVEGEFFIGSADLMFRNLLRRVEVLTPLLDPHIKNTCYQILKTMLQTDHQTWQMESDGNYKRLKSSHSDQLSSQAQLIKSTLEQ